MQQQVIELAQAQQLVAAALAGAAQQNLPIAVAVSDPAGHLVAFARMDGASYLAIDAALRKAVTAGGFRAPTHGLAQWAQRDVGFAAAFTSSSTLSLLPGGLPIMQGTAGLGGLGVAGGNGEQDRAIAEAALAALLL